MHFQVLKCVINELLLLMCSTVSKLMKVSKVVMFEATCTVVPVLLPDAKPGFKLSVILKGRNVYIENMLCHFLEGY